MCNIRCEFNRVNRRAETLFRFRLSGKHPSRKITKQAYFFMPNFCFCQDEHLGMG